MNILNHPSYIYTLDVLRGRIKTPKYVSIQCNQFRLMAEGKSKKYTIDYENVLFLQSPADLKL